jgi:hypothetical protein
MLTMNAVMIPAPAPSHHPTPLPTVEVSITMIFDVVTEYPLLECSVRWWTTRAPGTKRPARLQTPATV